MARDEDDDLYDEEFDFVDDDDDDDEDDESVVENADDSPLEDSDMTDKSARTAAPRGRRARGSP